MPCTRIAGVTLCGLLVSALLLARPVLRAEEASDPRAVERALGRVLTVSLPLERRLAAAGEALATGLPLAGPSAREAALALLEPAPETGLWLLLRARGDAFLPDGDRADLRRAIGALGALADKPAAARAAWAAAGLLVGHRPETCAATLTACWPPSDAVRAVLARETVRPEGDGEALLAGPDPAPVARLLDEQRLVLQALDLAEQDDVAAMRRGLDALVAQGERAVPVLMGVVAAQARGGEPGRLGRACRAAVALGMIGDRRATPALVLALDASEGWLEVAAATALGDAGDPSAAVALAHHLTYRGDVLRPRDQWDWPGERETNVPAEAWPTVEYYVTDVAAADALLRMGARGAAGWLIHERLDPRKANYRIRVLQDAVDALRRGLPPSAPVEAYNVDAGLPQRRAAFEALSAWWHAHRFDAWPGPPFDEDDPGYRAEARRMVERLRGRSVMELQIAQESCALLGRAATPSLLETLAATDNRVLRTEIARALGVVADARAVDPLLGLLRDPVAFVRATAAVSLGAYVQGAPFADRSGAVVEALLAALDDAEPPVCVAALKSLVAAPPSPRILDAVRTHDASRHRERFGSDDRDYAMAETVARLVQEGPAHWPAVAAGLRDGERYVRLAWWDLLRRALDLPGHVYDGLTDPGSDAWRPIDEARVLEALSRRRGT